MEGYSETEEDYATYEYEADVKLSEADERALAMFMNKEEGARKTLADVMREKLQLQEQVFLSFSLIFSFIFFIFSSFILSFSLFSLTVSSFLSLQDSAENVDARVRGEMHSEVAEVYSSVGKILKTYTSGKLPKAFKILPVLRNWEEVLYLTKPEEWSPCAVYQGEGEGVLGWLRERKTESEEECVPCLSLSRFLLTSLLFLYFSFPLRSFHSTGTKIFASNLNAAMAQRFYGLVLLPRVRADIQESKRLNYHLYQALRKAIYKPAAFFKGIILPLCEGMRWPSVSLTFSLYLSLSLSLLFSTHLFTAILTPSPSPPILWQETAHCGRR